MKTFIPRVSNLENYRNRVVKPLAVLSAVALISSGVKYEADKDREHSIDYLRDDNQVSITVHANEGLSTVIAEVDGDNLDPQTYSDLQKYVISQGQGHDSQGNPQLVNGQSVYVPDVHSPLK